MAGVLEQIRQAEEYKAEGNERFKEGNFKKALSAYHKVFCYVNGLQAPSDSKDSAAPTNSSTQIPKDKVGDVKKLRQSTNLNMAACYLKVGEPQKCVDACGKALEHGSSSKAYFRRSQALMELRNFGGARSDLQRCRELSPDNREVAQQLRRLKVDSNQSSDKEKNAFGGMFDSSPADPRAAVASGVQIEEVSGEAAEAAPENGVPAEPEPVESAEHAKPAFPEEPAKRTIDLDAQDEASKLDFNVRPLTYAWEQTDDNIKIYVPFDQYDELEGGVDRDRVETEFGEWSIKVVIASAVEGQPPMGLRLGDFHRRIDPGKSKCTVREKRLTLLLAKREKEHWFNILQRSGS